MPDVPVSQCAEVTGVVVVDSVSETVPGASLVLEPLGDPSVSQS